MGNVGNGRRYIGWRADWTGCWHKQVSVSGSRDNFVDDSVFNHHCRSRFSTGYSEDHRGEGAVNTGAGYLKIGTGGVIRFVKNPYRGVFRCVQRERVRQVSNGIGCYASNGRRLEGHKSSGEYTATGHVRGEELNGSDTSHNSSSETVYIDGRRGDRRIGQAAVRGAIRDSASVAVSNQGVKMGANPSDQESVRVSGQGDTAFSLSSVGCNGDWIRDLTGVSFWFDQTTKIFC